MHFLAVASNLYPYQHQPIYIRGRSFELSATNLFEDAFNGIPVAKRVALLLLFLHPLVIALKCFIKVAKSHQDISLIEVSTRNPATNSFIIIFCCFLKSAQMNFSIRPIKENWR